MLDSVVIGGGPAGLSAALWLGRYRRRAALFDAGRPRNDRVESSHGYLGLDGISPRELRERALRDLARYTTVELCDGAITTAERRGDAFVLQGAEGSVECASVIVATGVRDTYPDIPNLFDHLGTSVFNCPSCDGYEAQDRRVVVFGWSEELVTFAEHLLEWAASVVIVTDGPRFEGRVPPAEPISVVEADAVELLGSAPTLEGVRLADGSVVDADMAFFALDQQPLNDIARQLGCELTDQGCAVVDTFGMTTVEGVYAAGDLVEAPQLIQVAAASGAVAGISCAKRYPRR